MGKNLPKNYRPISLASICSKLLEHIVYSSICRFWEEILTPRQHGFRPGFTCETQLVAVVDTGLKHLILTFELTSQFSISLKHSTQCHIVVCWPISVFSVV